MNSKGEEISELVTGVDDKLPEKYTISILIIREIHIIV